MREDGFYDYFRQINARGEERPPEEVFERLVALVDEPDLVSVVRALPLLVGKTGPIPCDPPRGP